MSKSNSLLKRYKHVGFVIAFGGLLWVDPLPAIAFQFDAGAVNVNADITLGYGVGLRTEDAKTYPTSPNIKSETTYDDKSLVSNVGKITAELSADIDDFGAVCNLSYSYDYMIMNKDTERGGVRDPNFFYGLTTVDTGMGNDWSKGAEDESGSSLELLDGYVYGLFLDNSLDLRVGWQVINWGEGLFFMDSISEQTPFNLSKLVLPGSEIKEALMGVGAVQTQWAVSNNVSVDAYVQWEFTEHKLQGVGTFYGDDILGPGGQEEWANDSLLPGLRGSDIDADDAGQFGISSRMMVGNSEIGLYYSRYHEKMPMYTMESGSASPLMAEVLYYSPELNGGLTPEDWAAFGVTSASDLVGMAVPGSVLRQTYPEDIDLFGASIATTVGNVSLNGEIAYRKDRPLARSLAEYFLVQDGEVWEERDTINASAHILWLGGSFLGGVDSQFAAVQLGLDYIDDTDGLAPNYVITLDSDATVDSAAWGIATSWDGTWQAVASSNVDVTLSLFLQYDFSGNSHYWGNFAEGRVKSAIGLTGNFGTAWEANITYAREDFSDSSYENQDTINLSINYKF